MKISTEKLTLIASTNTFVGKSSELGLNTMPNNMELWNPKTNSSTNMDFVKHDTDGDEITGAHYSSRQGYKLLITND